MALGSQVLDSPGIGFKIPPQRIPDSKRFVFRDSWILDSMMWPWDPRYWIHQALDSRFLLRGFQILKDLFSEIPGFWIP